MTARKFASITASLLARKGEALPSASPGHTPVPQMAAAVPHATPHPIWSSSLLKHPGPDAFANIERSPIVERTPSAAGEMSNGFQGDEDHFDLAQFSDPGAKAIGANAHEKRHRISLAVSAQEHEKLGIVAIKKGLTRHQLLRNALDFYFEKLSREFEASCACIATEQGCANACADKQPLAG